MPRELERGGALPARGQDDGEDGAVAGIAAALRRRVGDGGEAAGRRAGDLRLDLRAAVIAAQGEDRHDDGARRERGGGDATGDHGGRPGADAEGRHCVARYRPAPLVTPALEVSALAHDEVDPS